MLHRLAAGFAFCALLLEGLSMRLGGPRRPIVQPPEEDAGILFSDLSTETDGIPDTVSGTVVACPDCGEEFVLMLSEDESAAREAN